MPELVLPTTRLRAAFLECRDDWGAGLHEDGFGIGDDDDLDSPEGFVAWVHERIWLTHPAGGPCPDERHGSPRWIVEAGQVLGASSCDTSSTTTSATSATAYAPSARRRGLAGWALGEMLVEARAALGLDRVLIPASRTTSPQPARSNTTAAFSKASATPSKVRSGATGPDPF